ncbi:MAG: hypothetical protein HFACDABA_01640 [Anaerolineales bacterium]|nr:hypothetical protein [Anaerolineales bacterium]
MTVTRPLLLVSIGFLGGLILAQAAPLPVAVWLALAFVTLLIGILWRFLTAALDLASLASQIVSISLFGIFLCLGAARYQWAIPTPDAFDLAWYNDRDYDVRVTGWVTEPPDARDTYANLRLRVTGLDTGEDKDLQVHGLLLVRVDPNEAYQYGDVLRLRGRLKSPPENEEFSYREYLAREGIYSIMSSDEVTRLPGREGNFFARGLFALKTRALETIYRLFPDPEASLLAGILLGVDNGLPDDLQQAFKDTGTSHIIAISGFNIAIIAELFLALFGRAFGKRRGAVFAGIGIVFYTLLVGADAAVVRAAVMGVTALFARHLGRRQDGINTLFGVAALMTLFNPLYISDVGFQLSFAATLGLVLYAQPLEALVARWLNRMAGAQARTGINAQETSESETRIAKTSNFISNVFLLTLAAQITTIPIMAYHFGRLSLISFIANPFILPAQPAVMILGGLADMLGMLFEPLGQAAAYIAWPFVAYTIHAVELFGGVSWAARSVEFPFWAVILWYAVLLGLTFAGPHLKELMDTMNTRFPKIPIWAVISGLTILVILIWRSALATPDGKLHITFLDVGSSDAILIQTPSGGTVLVNGGESISQLSSQLGARLPLFNRKIDWLIVASTQENQVNALPRLVERYPPADVLWAGNVEASFPSRTLEAWLTEHETRITRAEKDQVLDLGGGATLTVVTSNPRGAILLIEYEGFRALLPIGMDFDSLTELGFGAELEPVNLLLLADSGLGHLNPEEWIARLDPQLVVLSVAADDFNNLPDESVLETVGGRTLLRTDVNGWIEIVTDGTQVWVEAQRGGPPPTFTPTVESSATVDPFLTFPPETSDEFITEEPSASETPDPFFPSFSTPTPEFILPPFPTASP